jgi:hypothetical protein
MSTTSSTVPTSEAPIAQSSCRHIFSNMLPSDIAVIADLFKYYGTIDSDDLKTMIENTSNKINNACLSIRDFLQHWFAAQPIDSSTRFTPTCTKGCINGCVLHNSQSLH